MLKKLPLTVIYNMKKSYILVLLVLSCTKVEKPKSSFRVDLIDKNTRVQDNLFNHVNGMKMRVYQFTSILVGIVEKFQLVKKMDQMD